MSLALYRKYRPRLFAEVVSQDHVKTTLLNAISIDKIGHAYILVGARGIGKTTLARLFAKAINCLDKSGPEPCNKCEACLAIDGGKALDLLEIDAASNTGVDQIRELREKVKFTPAKLKYKVFIIDEVHMLSSGAFNALLKTLEEPPEHAVFLLATTEVHKIPATILSRCQRFDLKKLTVPELIGYLKRIAKSEGIEASREALELITGQADGCARDAVSLFTQVNAFSRGKIDQKLVKEILGVVDQAAIAEFIDHLIARSPARGVDQLQKLLENGYDVEQFTKNLIEYLRKMMVAKIGADARDIVLANLSSEQLGKIQAQTAELTLAQIVHFIKAFLDAQQHLGESLYPQLPLELALMELFGERAEIKKITPSSVPPAEGKPIERIKQAAATALATARGGVPQQAVTGPRKAAVQIASGIAKPVKSLISEKPAEAKESGMSVSSNLKIDHFKSRWTEVVQEVMPINSSLAAFLRIAVLKDFDGEYLTLAFKFRFHQERISDHKYRTIVEKVLAKVHDQKVLIKCVVDDSLVRESEPVTREEVRNVSSAPADVTELAKSIFGGKLV